MESERSDAGFSIVPETDRDGKKKVVRSEADVDFLLLGKRTGEGAASPFPSAFRDPEQSYGATSFDGLFRIDSPRKFSRCAR